ncbi:MAG: permease-like cell division protein FtsX [Gammaproteobacteria bacterium]|nr:permease-like cell division protein FtsX [Gammaproteobacteria bacterium]MDH3370013.1 permease-like cell division protein FtsX [Gammaproteobacteria bacterium]MDH3407240.1 permease-like cell division protein FtsX [Gammaproteobacteria bacterium]MDH5487863.1 permease-like cell division protein FtsX [Gammaproteobacteria bacterium]
MIRNYFLRHAQVFFYTLGQLSRTPVASFLTVAVIGITLALPAGLYVALENVQRLARGWEDNGQISLFLKQDLSDADIEKLSGKIRKLPAVSWVDYISRQAALAEFKKLSGFGDALGSLDRNPLPPVLIVHPAGSHTRPDALQSLLKDLRRYSEVELAQLDLEWVRRLYAMLDLAKQGVLILTAGLAVAVLLIIGNTIRLAVLNRRDEIEIIKLIGGTNTFIRRPFLYSGAIQGFLGAIMAWLLVGLGLLILSGPVHRLASLYGSLFVVENMGFLATLALIGTGGLLGWLGSRLAVGRHLQAIEPR